MGEVKESPYRFDFLITPRRGNRVQFAIADHMRHEARRLEYLCECRVADAQTAGLGAEGRHHRALAVASKAPTFHRTPACRYPRLGMQMPRDLT